MKVKNLNPIERHVEKIVLGVAVAAAAYLGWQGVEPTKIGPQKDIGPGQVEEKISEAIDKVKKGGAKTEDQIKRGELSVEVKNYYSEYQSKADAGLPADLIAANIRYLPLQPGGIVGPATQTQKFKIEFAIELPVPDPVNVHSISGRGKVNVPAAAPVAVPAGGAVAPVAATIERDATVVRISANYPMQELRDRIGNVRDPNPRHRLDVQLQFVSIYRLEVQRQERNPDGTWPSDEASWRAVTGLKNIEVPKDIPFKSIQRGNLKDVVAVINAAAGTILQPPMYDTGAGFFPPLPELVIPGAATAPVRAAPAVAPAISAPPFNGGGPPMFFGPGGPTGGPPMSPWQTGMPPGGPMGAPPVAVPADAGRVLSDATPAVWAYDENVLPEHEYQYRMRVLVVNPLFKYEQPKDLKQPELVSKPLLESSWVVAPEKVSIKPSSFFYVMNSGFGASAKDVVDIQIFKFFLGNWYTAWQKEVRAGTFIGDSVTPTNAAAPKAVDYSTGYTVVDIIPAGVDATVVLQSPSGQLTTRNIREDREEARKLEAEIAAEGKGPAKAPVAPPKVPGPPVGTPGGPPMGPGGGPPVGPIKGPPKGPYKGPPGIPGN